MPEELPLPLPPACEAGYFLALLEAVLAQRERLAQAAALGLGGAQPCVRRGGDQYERIHPYARLAVLLAGSQRYVFSHGGERREHRYRAGDCWYLAPHAWEVHAWDRPCQFLGIVFAPTYLRYLAVDFAGGAPPAGNTPWAYHTRTPAGPALGQLLTVLNTLAREHPDSSAGPDLFTALLHLCREHLAAEPPPQPGGKAEATWQLALNYLREHFGEPITRESVAAALGLHPNYLSALARQQSGQPFHATLTGIRLDAAKRLLLDTDLKLERVARLSGYQSARYFVSAFRLAHGYTPGTFRRRGPDQS